MFKILETIKENGYLKVKIHASGEYWEKLTKKAYNSLKGNLSLKGFRKGNVPDNVARANISENEIWNEATNHLIDDKVNEINEEIFKEKIIARPRISVTKLSASEIEMDFIAPLLPNVDLPELSNIKMEMDSIEPTNEELEQEFQKLQQFIFKNEETDAPSKLGDTVNIDFSGSINGEKFDGGTAKSFDLELGSKSFIDNFEEQLVGMKKGDSKTISVKFPEVYPVEELANKMADFEVKINKVTSKVESSKEELNEKSKQLGFDSFDELKSSLELMFREQKKADVYNRFIKRVISEILSMPETKLTIPDEIIESEISNSLKKFEEQLSQSKMKLSDYLKMISKTEEQFKNEDLRNNAIKVIEEQIIYEAIDEKANIQVSKEEIEEKYKQISSSQKLSINEIKEQIKDSTIENEIKFIKLVEMFIK